MSETKFHVALSFAGEDRKYVERVAKELRENDVFLFYDKFDEVLLWGKDLYTYLRDIYQNKAYFTVIFISEHYKNKRWTNHERESAQARAFSESREYILPARFDDTEIPGILPTTGYIELDKTSPKKFASLIIKKLKQSGIVLESDSLFSFSEDALADVDFSIYGKEPIYEIIRQLKTYNWHKQNPAIEKL
ncbi:MAG: toll/interleukin-1 receptor domain-containing protein, partial [Planctomycetota bacterium]